MIGYVSYFLIEKSEDFLNSAYNGRTEIYEASVDRGSILSADGQILAENIEDIESTEMTDQNAALRNYPFGRMFSHIVGYQTALHGNSGIEAWANYNLSRSNSSIIEQAVDEVTNEKYIGDNIYTTLDVDLQQTAYDALGTYKGAVIVMQPSTGKLLAVVSKPDFDPNTISQNWDVIVTDTESNSVLVNRATQGKYPPGSTFKTVTALEYIREFPNYLDYSYDCVGTLTIGANKISCYGNEKHGRVDLKESFTESCNTSFANIGLQLDLDDFSDTADSLLFNTVLPVSNMTASQSSFVLDSDSSVSEIMETAIGQGQTLVTPLHMLMLTSAVANEGILMEPYVIDHSETYDGSLVKQFDPVAYGEIMTKEESGLLKDFMIGTVETGTATLLSGQSYTAGGKTGSAEYSDTKGESHAWFTGFAESEDKEDIAIAVIVEGAGIGSEYAVPIAKKVFDEYFSTME